MTTMTDEEAFALGVRAVEARARHAIGMSAITRDGRFGLIVGLGHDGVRVLSQGVTATRSRMDVVPDLRDPGTKGHAVAQLRGRTGDAGLCVARRSSDGMWHMLKSDGSWLGCGPTEEIAIIHTFEETKETP